jgi:hypothetical protein
LLVIILMLVVAIAASLLRSRGQTHRDGHWEIEPA